MVTIPNFENNGNSISMKNLIINVYIYFLQLIECLKNASLGPTAAQGFHIVLHEYDDVMTTSMHANVRLMFRQRFFMQTSGRLVEGFNTASPGKY